MNTRDASAIRIITTIAHKLACIRMNVRSSFGHVWAARCAKSRAMRCRRRHACMHACLHAHALSNPQFKFTHVKLILDLCGSILLLLGRDCIPVGRGTRCLPRPRSLQPPGQRLAAQALRRCSTTVSFLRSGSLIRACLHPWWQVTPGGRGPRPQQLLDGGPYPIPVLECKENGIHSRCILQQ